VVRAEGALPGWFAEPLPPPCRVEPMSPHLGKAGTPPHYSPPTADGRRAGTYWFNVDEVGVGAGWDLAATAYHEAVPGHHLQLERMLTRTGLPAVQRLGFVTAHAEGWGLYAELLAGEMGLYETDEELAGALVLRMFRAARLVVDTGLHALGWSRSRAVDYVLENIPLNATELISEIDRYITMPGQALAYYTGFVEILRLREEAQATLGDAFDLAGFHAAVLDSGGVPLPALRTAVAAWVRSVQAADQRLVARRSGRLHRRTPDQREASLGWSSGRLMVGGPSDVADAVGAAAGCTASTACRHARTRDQNAASTGSGANRYMRWA
jgi:uncharacterized protein (DUF885 family)